MIRGDRKQVISTEDLGIEQPTSDNEPCSWIVASWNLRLEFRDVEGRTFLQMVQHEPESESLILQL